MVPLLSEQSESEFSEYSAQNTYPCDTIFQLYSKILKEDKKIYLKDFLILISFVNSAFKNASNIFCSKMRFETYVVENMVDSEGLSLQKYSKDPEISVCNEDSYEKEDKTEPIFNLLHEMEEIIIHHLISCKLVRAVVSSGRNEIIQGNAKYGTYIAYINPLDNQTRAELGYTSGSMFAFVKIPPEKLTCKPQLEECDVMYPLSQVEFGGFAVYGFLSELIIAVQNNGLQHFTLDPDLGLFVSDQSHFVIPKNAVFYSIDGGNSSKWPHQIKAFLDLHNAKAKPLQNFWPGSIIAALWAVLLSGGIYLSPLTIHLKSEVDLLSAAFPIALIMKEGGGLSFPLNYGLREEDFFHVLPASMHETTGICFGSCEPVKFLKDIYLEEIVIDKSYFT